MNKQRIQMIKKDIRKIKASGLFDPGYYLAVNEDVRKAKIDPLEHFVIHGWRELRNPSAFFNTSDYLRSNPKLWKQGLNPLLHYISITQGGGEIGSDMVKGMSESIHNAVSFNIATAYKRWINRCEPKASDLAKQKRTVLRRRPRISIVTPVFNTPDWILNAMMRSVLRQTYLKWELCLVDGGSLNPEIIKVLNRYADKDKRIKVKFLKRNLGIAGNTNEAIAMATGDYIAFLDHDDTLAPNALFEVARVIASCSQVDLMYSDEDHLSKDGQIRYKPFFKPDFSPDMLRSCNYMAHFLVIKKSLGDSLGWLRKGFDGAQDHDLILRATEKACKIVHITKILYHWRETSLSMSWDVNSKKHALGSGQKCVEEHLKRAGLKGSVEIGHKAFSSFRVRYNISGAPLVSIIIPNKDHFDDLYKCIRSIITKSTYKNFEILIIENRSQTNDVSLNYKHYKKHKFIRVFSWDHPFNFSRLNNFASRKARGDVLLFLNNDTEVMNPEWIENMLQYALRSDVGAVGAKLFYPLDGTVQHGGVIVGLGGVAGHSHKNIPGDHIGDNGRLTIDQNLSAVTGACLMMRKKVFQQVRGFDPSLAVAFNDVDLCLRIRKLGYLIVWTPYAELYHYESKSRGLDVAPEKRKRFLSEIRFFRKRWKNFLAKGDPYYNSNLTGTSEDFSLKTE